LGRRGDISADVKVCQAQKILVRYNSLVDNLVVALSPRGGGGKSDRLLTGRQSTMANGTVMA